jgi:hypothetical protein
MSIPSASEEYAAIEEPEETVEGATGVASAEKRLLAHGEKQVIFILRKEEKERRREGRRKGK